MMDTSTCNLCGRHCEVRRNCPNPKGGFCGAVDQATVGLSQAVIHHGEEPPLSGKPPGGSGAIFFTRCNLACVFCQNSDISQTPGAGQEVTVDTLVALMFELKRMGAYNINLVSPTQYAFQLAQAIYRAKNMGLDLPVVYNTGGYDSDDAIDLMDGLVDVYLPDAKLGNQGGKYPEEYDSRSQDFLGVPDYPEKNMKAIERMLRQVGHLTLDDKGLATRGLLVRHLVLPDNLARTDRVLAWIHDKLGPDTYLALMAQYFPRNKVELGYSQSFANYPGLGRPLSVREYDEAVDRALALGLFHTYIQDLSAATYYLPDFSKPGIFS
ncbi:MAG: radical SAM protein [Deltaproteobacteria bacterium]|jgi:putative pyruvate formate lyase activating enzyme|nr:radical SAM protein [Deltaproteobacteria bacterium]